MPTAKMCTVSVKHYRHNTFRVKLFNFKLSIMIMNKTNGICSTIVVIILLTAGLFIGLRIDRNRVPGEDVTLNNPMIYLAVKDVKVNDSFWSPKLKLWSDITVNDIFNKFEGGYDAESRPDLLNDYKILGRTQDAFRNFDLVAQGKRGVGQKQHDGPPWYDGLVYETIRGRKIFSFNSMTRKLKKELILILTG